MRHHFAKYERVCKRCNNYFNCYVKSSRYCKKCFRGSPGLYRRVFGIDVQTIKFKGGHKK